MAFLAVDGLGNSLEGLPKGKLVLSSKSADKKMSLNIYKAELNGVDTAVRGEVVFEDGSLRNIYWDIGQEDTSAKWANNDTVIINGNYISIDGIVFDSRRRIELPEASYKNIESKIGK
jgi:hypothetical protein